MAQHTHESPQDLLPHVVEEQILTAIRPIRCGSVEIIVHDSRVVQIQRTEKVRFDHAATKQ